MKMLIYERAQLNSSHEPNAIKGYLMATRAIRTISCEWSCAQRVALFVYLTFKNPNYENSSHIHESIYRRTGKA